MTNLESHAAPNDRDQYDLVAEERMKRRYYFIATPLAILLALGAMIAGVQLLPTRHWLYAFAFSIALARLVEELVMAGSLSTKSRAYTLRRATVFGIGMMIAAWLFQQLGFSLEP